MSIPVIEKYAFNFCSRVRGDEGISGDATRTVWSGATSTPTSKSSMESTKAKATSSLLEEIKDGASSASLSKSICTKSQSTHVASSNHTSTVAGISASTASIRVSAKLNSPDATGLEETSYTIRTALAHTTPPSPGSPPSTFPDPKDPFSRTSHRDSRSYHIRTSTIQTPVAQGQVHTKLSPLY